MELVYGTERHPAPEKMLETIETMVARMEVLPFDDEAAHHTGKIRAELAKAGTQIGPTK